jgi:hypothetical protein
MRLVAIVLFALFACLAGSAVACGHAEEPKPPVPLQLIDITGPRTVVQALNLGTMDGLVITRKAGTMLDEEWTISAKATDDALAALSSRGCTAENHCTVHIASRGGSIAPASPDGVP